MDVAQRRLRSGFWLLAYSVLVTCALVPSCSDDPGEQSVSPSSFRVSADSFSPTTPTAEAPKSVSDTSTPIQHNSSPPSTLDPVTSCLGEALGSHPELLDALDGGETETIDRLRAILVARKCLPKEQLSSTLAGSLQQGFDGASGYQAECLADQMLALPDQELSLLIQEPVAGATTMSVDVDKAGAAEIRARLLRLCGLETS